MDCPKLLEDCPEDEDADALDDDEKKSLILIGLPDDWKLQEPFMILLQENVNFENFIKFKLNKNAHLLVTNDNDLRIFIVIDNEVVIETDSYINGLLSYFEVHYVFNLEYPKKTEILP
ncbi:PREDICTED: uncharacterized protein LOC107338205 [Acropora digitifera]|uniref:uncharacterized protein LOC107338205 n=1 Tax=Acropora digitifera TaxID=70779 RepID=UPI00077A2A74|nr:PREDICTED: uncharacterized protein LOC107338205 [Acropora digitifera]XP_015758924.1 PREDICTED: uncharacterized protein LOC107338205 [Acropora digitifera]